MQLPKRTVQPKRRRPGGNIAYGNFLGGENTVGQPIDLSKNELSKAVDWKYTKKGGLVTREPFLKFTDSAMSGGVKTIGYSMIGGQNVTFGCDDNNNLYYLSEADNLFPAADYNTFSTWTQFGTPIIVKDQAGITGEANTASTIQDDDVAAREYVRYSFTVANGEEYTTIVYVEKDAVTSRYPVIGMQFFGGTSKRERIVLKTSDGSFNAISGENDGVTTVTQITGADGTLFWKVKQTLKNNATGNTILLYELSPAGSTDGSTINVAAIGTATFTWCSLQSGSGDNPYPSPGYATSGSVPINYIPIGTVTGPAEFLEYNNDCIVMDGGNIKRLDGSFKALMNWDTSETAFDNYSGATSGAQAISTAGVGCGFTTVEWDEGYTMPPTNVTMKLMDTTTGGSGTVDTVSFYDVAASAEIASTECDLDLSASMEIYSVSIPLADVTTQFSPKSEYLCLVKGDGVSIGYTTVTSGGSLITGGAGPADSTKTPIMKINPGPPPKAAYGVIADSRPFFWGDPDNKGMMHEGRLTIYEYRSIPSVDKGRNSYEIGGIGMLYDDLWVIGTESQPYKAVLTGETEADWELKGRSEKGWTSPRTIKNIGDFSFSASKSGVGSLGGVQEYGNVRSSNESDSIQDKFDKYWSDSAFAGFFDKENQYWLFLPGYDHILICHTELEGRPWTRYKPPFTPTYFKQAGPNFLCGGSDGHFYHLSNTHYKDLATTHIEPDLKFNYYLMDHEVDLVEIFFIAQSLSGANFTLNIYTNGDEATPVLSKPFNLTGSDALKLEDMTMELADALFSLDPPKNPPKREINIPAWSFMVEIADMKIIGNPVKFNGFYIKFEESG